MIIWYAFTGIVAMAIGAGAHFAYRALIEGRDAAVKKTEGQKIVDEARAEAEKIRKEGELKAKEIVADKKSEMDREIRESQKEFAKMEKRILSREENLDKKYEALERRDANFARKEQEVREREAQIESKQAELDAVVEEARRKIEYIAGMSREDAKNELVNIIEDEARVEAAKRLKQIEDDLNDKSEELAKNIISIAIQRYAGEYTSEKTITVVNLPSDDMKGRIIGREGRNIRSIEARTGVDIIIDDTPETVVLSSLNPIRREVARISLEKLIADGRIHPARIEDVVTEVEGEVDREIQKVGERAVFDVGASGMHPDLVKLIGKLKFRTSYSQNILNHSLEVAFISGIIASQLGVNPKLAKRAGLLHDIGKSVDHEVEGSHVDIGANLVRKYGEIPEIVEAVTSNHNPNSNSILAVIIHAADAISAARPGARLEMYESYVQRINDMENIAASFKGVEKCYAIQAGREVRVIVESSKINDDEAVLLSMEIAKRIQSEVAYPGQVKITVIREVRSSAYAS
ncbi:MAG: ribonuclease Y [Candidatus Dadabacteria bacterium]|nr:ribonuclease Y [Candidatus Dadabacteria bacterium]